MGSINYFTSDFITLGVNCSNIEDHEEESYFIQEDFDMIESILQRENFYYFNVRIRPGYYEGFSIDIEYNFAYCLDSYRDKIDALREITSITTFLLKCINDFGLCAVSPGWCTTYYSGPETIERLKRAIKEMRETVKKTPTWRQVRREEINA